MFVMANQTSVSLLSLIGTDHYIYHSSLTYFLTFKRIRLRDTSWVLSLKKWA